MKYVVTKYEVICFTKQIQGCITPPPPLRKAVLKLLTAANIETSTKYTKNHPKAAKVLDFSESEDRFQLLLGPAAPRGLRGVTQGRAAVSRTIANHCKPLETTSDTLKKQRDRVAGAIFRHYLKIQTH